MLFSLTQGVEACEAMNGCLTCLAKEYPTVKFCRLKASDAQLSGNFVSSPVMVQWNSCGLYSFGSKLCRCTEECLPCLSTETKSLLAILLRWLMISGMISLPAMWRASLLSELLHSSDSE